ncbi:hypothetical protein EHS25_001690 [Saitozyma podzolica]|uniref:J domain-containing protein n=1 Tax=Saitozyma podzolica TaxID=1890683 RepID=A0A427YGV6_9TREE|nr:hypothetical protein EHS25_001690 [Saitozyma podzolica]
MPRMAVRYAHAHAAAAEEPSDPDPGPSRPRDPYRFPQSGRGGGPPDPFEVLGLDRSADEAQIKRQYYKLAKMVHPDSSHPSSSPTDFATLHKAYTLLSEPSSRSMYLSTGYGWSTGTTSNPMSWSDAQMRAEVASRRRGGAAAWGPGHRGYRDSDAGRGAWNHSWDDGYGFQPTGTGEERYMSNSRFLALLGAISVVTAWAQYHRAGWAADTHRELLDRQHANASYALAEARQEAALHGKERRERIRRRVREQAVLKEVERMEKGHDVH